jgi:hypothetical protein
LVRVSHAEQLSFSVLDSGRVSVWITGKCQTIAHIPGKYAWQDGTVQEAEDTVPITGFTGRYIKDNLAYATDIPYTDGVAKFFRIVPVDGSPSTEKRCLTHEAWLAQGYKPVKVAWK